MEKKTQTESFNYHDKVIGAKKKKEQGNVEELTHLLTIEIVIFIICLWGRTESDTTEAP